MTDIVRLYASVLTAHGIQLPYRVHPAGTDHTAVSSAGAERPEQEEGR